MSGVLADPASETRVTGMARRFKAERVNSPCGFESRAHVLVELLGIKAIDTVLHYSVAYTTVHGSPDDAARSLALDADVLHSTSWRWYDGTVLLTYVAVDVLGRNPAPVTGHHVLTSLDTTSPTPSGLTIDHVVVHAVRHLDYLRQTDPVIATKAVGATWQAIARLAEGVHTVEATE